MNSHGTCLKLFNFQGEASPLIDADKPAVELADSISWLVLLSKDNITTADSLPYLPHALKEQCCCPGPKAAWLWIVGVCGICGWKKGLEGFLKTFLEHSYYSVVFPMYGLAARAGRMVPTRTSGCCLFRQTWANKPLWWLLFCLLVCLFVRCGSHYLACICGIVYLSNVNVEVFLWRYTPRLIPCLSEWRFT